jgi:cytochrome c oxidase subunit 1
MEVPNNLLGLNVLMTFGAVILMLGQVPFILNFWLSVKGGRKVTSDNPWNCTTLEWATPTPPPHGNFTFDIVAVRGPYEYSVPGMNQDYFPQWESEPGKAAEPASVTAKAISPAHH